MVKMVTDALTAEGIEIAQSYNADARELEQLKNAAINGTRKLSVKLQKAAQDALDDYLANKEERDKEAFFVIDCNQDGMLQEKEVMEALLPETKKNSELMAALGFDPKELMKVLRGEVHKEAGCHQQ